jgi:CheY-like chemotaxis protein
LLEEISPSESPCPGADASDKMDVIRVLVIEDNAGDARLVGQILASAREAIFEVRYARNLGSALRLLKNEAVDVALLDLQLPDAWELEGVRRVSAAHPSLPVIALTGSDVPQTILDTIRIGARDYFVKGRISPTALITAILRQVGRIRQLASAEQPGASQLKEPQRIQVLVVEDNPGDFAMVRQMLGPLDAVRFDLVHAARLSDAVEKLRQHFDVILLDLGLPDSNDLDTLRRIRAFEPSVPILVLTGLENRQKAVEALANGAQDYLVKGQVDKRLLSRAILRHAGRQDRNRP